jgi:hypothetical protein
VIGVGGRNCGQLLLAVVASSCCGCRQLLRVVGAGGRFCGSLSLVRENISLSQLITFYVVL